jgi:adrenodoxin-NADP+ reductase
VGWYNGLPRDTHFPVNLDVEEVAVLGHGNVALDVARILLTPVDKLKVGLVYT